MVNWLAEFFRDGGPFMFVNLAIFTIALANMIERAVALIVLNLDSQAFMAQIHKLVMANNLDRAIKLCAAAPKAVLARVVKAGLSRAHRGPREVGRALEEAVVEVTPVITKRIQALWSFANIATLVGLIGTITGLIGTFRALGAASPEMKQIMLSRGIAEAMNNTALGLTIAVSCIIAHLLLNGRSRALLEDVEFQALRLENMLSQRGGNEQAPIERSA